MKIDKIVCFGKNYSDHMLELGDKVVEKPVIFLKPGSSLKQALNWHDMLEVELTEAETHYECEIVLSLANGGYKMTPEQAKNAIGHYTIGLDLTLRKLQRQLKDDGHPWTIAKVFPNSAVIAPWLEYKQSEFDSTEFSFALNSQLKQHAHINNMLFSPLQLIQYASNFFPLTPGDILFTGTPSGVGKLDNNTIGELCINKHTLTCRFI